jgi:hypothetical protein
MADDAGNRNNTSIFRKFGCNIFFSLKLEIRRPVLNAEITRSSGLRVGFTLQFLDLDNSKFNIGLRISKLVLESLT